MCGMTHPSSRRAAYAAVLGGCLVLFSRDARADGAASRLHLRYEAPAGCPRRTEVLAALDSRIQTSWVDGSDTRSFDVRVTRAADGTFTGRLEIRQPDRAPRGREIRGESCKAVATSLAVFIAIAVDPESEAGRPEGEGPRAHEEGVDREEREEREEGEEREEEAPPPTQYPVAPAPRAPRAPAPSEPRREQEPPTVWTWRTGYALAYGRSPRPGWGHRLDAELAWGDARARLVPALRLSWGWADFSTYPPLAGEARFQRKSVRLEGCGRLGLRPFTAAACAGADAGALIATAPELPRFFQVTTRWLAATGTLRVAWSFAPWLELETSAVVLVPLERSRFTVQEPRRLVYRAPFALFEGTVGISVVARFR